jgi:hypothetical protein
MGGVNVPIDVPDSDRGGFGTQVNGITNGNVAGGVYSDPSGRFHGFLWSKGKFYRVDCPNKPYSEVNGLNTRGDVTGDYASEKQGNTLIGFVAFRKGR